MIAVVGAGAFGTALAIALARTGQPVTLWARNPAQAADMSRTRSNDRYLANVKLPENVTVTAKIEQVGASAVVLLAVPTQALRALLTDMAQVLDGMPLVACCKGLDLQTWAGPSATIAACCPKSGRAVLTGPAFAIDIAQGLPTAMTLAGGSAEMQRLLSTPTLRVYLTDDVIGAELGGALKNVIAIAAGAVIGAGLGASARAALVTRGFAEMVRLAIALGARAETMSGLSGLGDLVLTATSPQSRNFCYGMALGKGEQFGQGVTVEGATTALAIARLAKDRDIDLPITQMVADLIEKKVSLSAAIETLLSRPLKEE